MKQLITLVFVLFLFNCSYAQKVAGFENFNLKPGEWLDGSDLSGGFKSGGVFLPNDYNTDYFSWIGFAISATTDTMTPGYSNQYSAITGGGVDGSDAYAVRYDFAPSIVNLLPEDLNSTVEGFYVTNSTYAYLSIRDGDAFAKKFGGETGDDPDYFLLTIKAFADGALSSDSVNVYLADYRFADNKNDYILKEWQWVDLEILGKCDSLWFNLTSTDVGIWGMNTPAYFCIDNITTSKTSFDLTDVSDEINFYPNPVQEILFIETVQAGLPIEVITANGQVALRSLTELNKTRLDVSQLPTGSYAIRIRNGSEVRVSKFIKS